MSRLLKHLYHQEYCQWFAMCQNLATTTRPHPTLGDVPICDRCNTKTDALEA